MDIVKRLHSFWRRLAASHRRNARQDQAYAMAEKCSGANDLVDMVGTEAPILIIIEDAQVVGIMRG